MSCFTKALKGLNEYRSIIYDLNNRRLPAGVVGLSAIHKAHVIRAACEDLAPHRAIIITPDEAQASKLCKDLNAFGCEAQLYPQALNCQGGDEIPSPQVFWCMRR